MQALGRMKSIETMERMPPHRTYVEACMGSAEVFLRKKPVEKEIINDYNGDLVRFFRVLQRNENLKN